jgi:hypothetical protein
MEWIEEQISFIDQIDWTSEWQKIETWLQELVRKSYYNNIGSYEVTWQN